MIKYSFRDDGDTPNHPDWPLVIYEDSFNSVSARELERTFRGNRWTGTWRNGIFSYTHYHSNAHEVLGITRGEATVQFGGKEGEVLELSEGDIAVLPAGCGHKNLESHDLLVVGGYPEGQTSYDLVRSQTERPTDVMDRIRAVPRPVADPVHGPNGPLLDVWSSSES